MTDLSFLRPSVAYWLAAATVVFLLWRAGRPDAYLGSTTVAYLRRRYRASLVRRLPIIVALAALAFITVAAMDPVLPFTEGQIRSRGVDIVLVLDLSSSMQEVMDAQRPATMPALSFTVQAARATRATAKTRLDTTKDALRAFIRSRRDDRLGLVVFSDNAYIVSPLTFDRDYLLHYVDMVDEDILRGEGMTAIGEGVALSAFLLQKQAMERGRNHVIVVFTDGENNHGREPVQAIDDAVEAGNRVHVIGVDIDEEIKVKPAVQQLIQAVRQHGGRYYDADTAAELRAAESDVDKLEKGTLTSKVSVRNAPVYHWFALPGALLAALAFVVRALPYFTDIT
jgi:Ca-activated chloride channel family protein